MIGIRSAGLLLLAATVLPACSHPGTTAGARATAGRQPTPGIYPQSRLLLAGDPGSVLVRIGGDPALTVAEFNERLMEFPVGDTGQGVAAARREILEQMIDVKMIAREAARRWPAMRHESAGPTSLGEERALVQTLIKSDVANPLLVSDDEARTYYESHRSAFEQLDASSMGNEERMLQIKFTYLSERFQAQIRAWRSRQTIEVADDLLKG
jgi:hypothetical protein